MALYGVARLIDILGIAFVPGASEDVAVSVGFNTLTRPDGADGAIIVPYPNSTATFTLKGVDRDTGLALSPISPSIVTCAANIGITVAGANTTLIVRWFCISGTPF